MSVEFEWDPLKAAANWRKHGVSFYEAMTVFGDDDGVLIHDLEHSTHEDRFLLLGLSIGSRILAVVHCERGNGDIIRIISARKANTREHDLYTARRGS